MRFCQRFVAVALALPVLPLLHSALRPPQKNWSSSCWQASQKEDHQQLLYLWLQGLRQLPLRQPLGAPPAKVLGLLKP